MTWKHKYVGLFFDRSLGSRLSGLSIGFGFLGFALPHMLLNQNGDCNVDLLAGLNQTVFCYFVFICPFVVGFVLGCVALFQEMKKIDEMDNVKDSVVFRGSGKRDSSGFSGGGDANIKLVKYLGFVVLCVALWSVYSVVQPSTYFDMSVNIFPIITLAILFVVYFVLLLSIAVRVLVQKRIF